MTPGSPPISAATRRSILLLSFATFSSMASQRLCDAMLPELARVFSVTLSQAARVISVFAIVYGLSQLFYGPLGDRLGKFRIVMGATLLCAVGSGWAVFAADLNALVLARVLVALGAAAIIPLSLAWIGDTVAVDQVQETLARVGLGTTLGIVGGQIMGGLFTDTLGWRWAFGFMALLFGIVGCLLAGDWRRQRAAPAAAAAAPGAPRPRHAAQVWALLTGRWSGLVLGVAFVEGAAGFGVIAMWASHLHDALGFTLGAAGAVVALYGLGGMLYMAVARRLIRRFGAHGLAALGVALFAAAAVVIAFTPAWPPVLPASLLAGFGFFMFHNTMQAQATQMAPEARGTSVSMFALLLFLGQSVGVGLAAAVIDLLGSRSVIALGAGVVLAVGLVFAQALRARARRA